MVTDTIGTHTSHLRGVSPRLGRMLHKEGCTFCGAVNVVFEQEAEGQPDTD